MSVFTFRRPGQRGFTLIELSVVLVVIGLLLGGLILPLRSQTTIRYTNDTRDTQADIVQALLFFAATPRRLSASDPMDPPRLPCPDITGDGLEDIDRSSAPWECLAAEGYLPWRTLGTGRQDAWGRPFRYRPDAAFADYPGVDGLGDIDLSLNPDAGIGDAVAGSGLDVRDIDGNNRVMSPAAIVFSCGSNGVPDLAGPLVGTTADDGNDADGQPNSDADCSNPNLDPSASDPNLPLDAIYLQAAQRRVGAASTEFDDILIWIPKSLLLGKLVEAGRWP